MGKILQKGNLAQMSVFENYASYYDLIYQDKDYKDECDFLELIFSKYSNKPIKTILDFGCGTGGHALILAERGYNITGVDISKKMIEIGKAKTEDKRLNIKFIQGDLRGINIGKKFDAVIAMFAVISYQVTNEDLRNTFDNVRKHLKKGGLFIFDFWFGPAVVTQRPNERMKIIKRSGERIIRFASPALDIMAQTVQVNYKLLQIRNNRIVGEVNESHMMRFLFAQEIEHFLTDADFQLIKLCPFLNIDDEVTEQNWNATVIAERL